MGSELINRVGQEISVTYRFIIDGEHKVEYIQGTLIETKGSAITIKQYIPYIEFLRGNKPQAINRELFISDLRDIKFS